MPHHEEKILADQRKMVRTDLLVRPTPRQAYEDGMPIDVVRRRYHLSRSEAEDVAPEEFDVLEMREDRSKVSGY